MKEILEAIARGYAVVIQPHPSGISVRIFEGNDLYYGRQYGKACGATEQEFGLLLRSMPNAWKDRATE